MTTYAENRKARYDYEILETVEAGVVLIGQEVKSIKAGKVNLAGSYVVFGARAGAAARARAGAPALVGVKIPPYQPKNAPADYNPERPRQLLLNQKEIDYLAEKSRQRGFSLIPLKIYESHGRIKIAIGLARGRKQYDKKEKLKKRDAEREVRRTLRE